MGIWTLGKQVRPDLAITNLLIGTAARSLEPKLLKRLCDTLTFALEREECEHDDPFYSNNSKPRSAPMVRVALETLNAS